MLFSCGEREVGGGGEALGEGLFVVGKVGPRLERRITARAGVAGESFVIIAAYHFGTLATENTENTEK